MDDKLIQMLENSSLQEIEVDQDLILNVVSKIERKKSLNELKLSILFVVANVLFGSILTIYMIVNNVFNQYFSWLFFLYILPIMLYSFLYAFMKSNKTIFKSLNKLEV